MKLKDLKIDAKATLGRRIVLTNIAPKYVYEGGRRLRKWRDATIRFSVRTGNT